MMQAVPISPLVLVVTPNPLALGVMPLFLSVSLLVVMSNALLERLWIICVVLNVLLCRDVRNMETVLVMIHVPVILLTGVQTVLVLNALSSLASNVVDEVSVTAMELVLVNQLTMDLLANAYNAKETQFVPVMDLVDAMETVLAM